MRNIKLWVDKSWKLPGLKQNPMLAVDFQSLGRFDIEIVKLTKGQKNATEPSLEEAMAGHYASIYARIWVLAGYEIVRVLKNLDERFISTYSLFRKVRVPLAKYEKSGRPGEIHIAPLVVSVADGQVGWETDQNEFITRDRLANELLQSVQE